MQPINYLISQGNPLDNILGYVEKYQNISNNANVLASQFESNRLKQAENDRQILAMGELQGLDFNDENAVRHWASRYGDLPFGKGVQAHIAGLDERTKKAEIGRLSQTYSLLQNGQHETAVGDLLNQAVAYENAGDKANADGARQMAKLIQSDPTSALQMVAMSYAYAVPKDTTANYETMLKANKTDLDKLALGDRTVIYGQNPLTGKAKELGIYHHGQSPDNLADNTSKEKIAQWVNQNNIDVANTKGAWDVKGTHVAGQYRLEEEKISQAGANARAGAEIELKKWQESLQQNGFKPVSAGGKMWLVNASGQYVPMTGDDGQQLLSESMVKSTAKANATLRQSHAELQGQQDQINQTINVLNQALALSKQGIYDGYFSNGRADFMGNFGGTEESRRTQQYNNLITNSALQSMKSIFGGNPTEGERAILLKIQASSEYPAETRHAILQEAIRLAEAKLQSNQQQIAIINGQSVPSQPQQQSQPQQKQQPPQQVQPKQVNSKQIIDDIFPDKAK